MMYPYVVITPNYHPHDYVRPSRPGRIDGRGWSLIELRYYVDSHLFFEVEEPRHDLEFLLTPIEYDGRGNVRQYNVEQVHPMEVSHFANCGFYTCFILHVVHVPAFASLRGFLHFILHSSVCVFLLFIFPDTDQLWVLFGAVLIIMAHSPDKIKSIDGSKETLKLSVRINDLWFIGTPNKSEQAEMVFVDSNCVLRDIPFRKYRFAGFADVVASQFEPGLLVDVIGVVEEVVFHQVSGKGRRVVFKLKDLR
ncbi:hypothetical protein JHK86_006600 [Glycine max]|nr:hypothetical protein JHK86_006600 [Glycine max]